jgi:hypothetical protein
MQENGYGQECVHDAKSNDNIPSWGKCEASYPSGLPDRRSSGYNSY